MNNNIRDEVYKALQNEKPNNDTKISMFSDSIIISSSNLKDILDEIAQLTAWLLSLGFLFRGGIGYGKFCEMSGSKDILLVSEGLVQAVEIESKQAIYPRIMLHASVMKELQLLLKNPQNSIYNFAHYIIQDESDSWFINPFFLNPDISDIIEKNNQNISKYDGYDFCNKYVWLQELCEYFMRQREIRSNPRTYYSGENYSYSTKGKVKFFYPEMFLLSIFGEKNYNFDETIYLNTFQQNVLTVLQQNDNN
ncbi:hypothetical protein [Clostridium botulinum]|uniref:hypothetical protein n=1 Tax=Clostridium botulinum TaxID=1491 RepID=UPI000A176AD5|nr:hypothetical protein [Clostridium botulinum]OSA79296.1 hypothetical protein B2H89_12545 [Clostridium botulinum]